ncbi:MAG TPA: HPr family phosphocarrier protein [Candidatus Hydrogenedentes bacterium]|jgi:phosphocarrier protein|nr:MAG: Phosphocarrier protein HPr [Candidatus Hydrogenedentes bacterium ADurb.Bin101]HOC68229.1 HPr family phosphocarrier protein [Candidatus Hydrogenedentota bacterium]HQM99961.1 HPr family phosphocarrier protein [Candidatus Hydrogenedentota bacterium]
MYDVSGDVVVNNALGIHARPAAALARRASEFESDIYIRYDDNLVNAKSIMGLLTLGAAHGTRLVIHCKGPDASGALAAIKQIFESGFGEP